jgi:hypothetical protein
MSAIALDNILNGSIQLEVTNSSKTYINLLNVCSFAHNELCYREKCCGGNLNRAPELELPSARLSVLLADLIFNLVVPGGSRAGRVPRLDGPDDRQPPLV